MKMFRLRNGLDIYVSYAGIILAIIIMLLNIAVDNEYTLTLGPILFFTCVFYLKYRNKKYNEACLYLYYNKRYTVYFLACLFWIFFSISLFVLQNNVLHRPLIYFIIISIAASLIAIQILLLNKIQKNYVILIIIEILALSINIRAGAYWAFPYLPGSDPWVHLEYIKSFIQSAHIPNSMPETIQPYYLRFPIMHLLLALIKLLINLNYKAVLFLSVSVPLAISTVFIYLLGSKLFNTRIGLLAMLLLNISDHHICWSYHVMATSIGLILVSIILYLIYKKEKNNNVIITIITLLLSFILILTHTLSSFVLLIFLLSYSLRDPIYYYINKKKNFIKIESNNLLIVFGVTLLAYWLYSGSIYASGANFLEHAISFLYINILNHAGFLQLPTSLKIQKPMLDLIFTIIGFLIMVLFGIIGCLRCLSKTIINKTLIWIVISILIIFSLIFGTTLFGLNNIVPYRWFAFVYLFLSLTAALGFVMVIYRKSIIKTSVFAFIVIFIFSFFMTSNKLTNMDSPFYAQSVNQKLVYTDSEVATGAWVKNYYNGTISSDFHYKRCILLLHLNFYQVSTLGVDYPDTGMVIWRKVLRNRPIEPGDVLGMGFERSLNDERNLVYENGTSSALLKASL